MSQLRPPDSSPLEQSESTERLYTVQEAADKIGLSIKRIYQLIREGYIGVVEVEIIVTDRRVPESEVLKFNKVDRRRALTQHRKGLMALGRLERSRGAAAPTPKMRIMGRRRATS